jgi:hypothetical protein
LDATGLLFYNARYYDPGIGRFLSADTVVPGTPSGTLNGVAVTPLTVDFHESGFRSKLNSESKAPFWFQMDSDARQQHGSPLGPANPQALNRYAYVQNNPLKYTDPSGHYTNRGDEYYGYESVCGADGQAQCTGTNDYVHPVTGDRYVRVWVNGVVKIVNENSEEFKHFKDQLEDYLDAKAAYEAALFEYSMALAAAVVACAVGGPATCAAAFAVYTVTAANVVDKELKLQEVERRLRTSFIALK